MTNAKRKLLLVSQVYAPDPAAVARLMADVGTTLALRGHDVVVLSAARGYDNPATVYPSGVTSEGVTIQRLPLCSFGKRSLGLRALAGLSFTIQSILRGLAMGRVDAVLVTTSPPMGAMVGVALRLLRRIPVVYWPMDLNPDQVLALGLATDKGAMVRLMGWLNRMILRHATAVIALDSVMAGRLEDKHPVRNKLVVIPPWPEQDDLAPIAHEANPFRREHELEGKTVIMYSGTLGPSNPVDTLLDAAERFEDDPDILFLFVGGGTGMADVKARGRPNIRCLPYEPLDRMPFSLAAADVHVVAMGDSMAGIVHPCKVYGAMASERPVLFLGPERSHVGEMLAEAEFGWLVAHGDVEGAVEAIREIRSARRQDLEGMGRKARELIERGRTRAISSGRVADTVERVARGTFAPAALDEAFQPLRDSSRAVRAESGD